MPDVLVFESAACQSCKATERWLQSRGIEFTAVRVDLLPEAGEKLRSAGHLSLPVVSVTREDGGIAQWEGHRPSMLEMVLGGAE